VLNIKNIRLKIRLRIFEALITSIFLYNAELWTLKYKQKVRTDTFQRSFLSQILRTKRKKNTTNLYRRCNSIPLTITIQQRRLKWFGYMHRLPEDSPAKIAYRDVTEKPTKKTKGGQKLTWHQIITRDLKTIDIDLQKAIKLSKDRDLFNEMVVDRVMAKAVNNFFPEDGDPEQVELSQDED